MNRDFLEEAVRAIEQWQEFGIESKGKCHLGYFGPGGWAYETLDALKLDLEKMLNPVSEKSKGLSMNRKFYELALKYFASEENGGIDVWSAEQERAGELLNDMADLIMSRRRSVARAVGAAVKEHAEKS